MNVAFKALADDSRRLLLDQLRKSDGQTLGELCRHLEMSRQAVTKHLVLLEKANLVAVVWRGREKLHYLNPVPLHEIYERWIRKYDHPHLQALSDLKMDLEQTNQPTKAIIMDKPKFVYVTYINTTPEKLWEALTKPEFTRQYWFDSGIESQWNVGKPVQFRREGEITHDQTLLKYEPPRLLSYSWHQINDAELRNEKPSRVTFEIEPGAPGQAVKLTVTHDDFPADSKVFPRISNGWPAVLSGLKSLLESGKAIDLYYIKCASSQPK